MEREEKSPYRGFGLIAALGVDASIWAGLIWAVLPMSSRADNWFYDTLAREMDLPCCLFGLISEVKASLALGSN
jgi:hypothetical protein